MTTIGLLHPGEMGAAVGATLTQAGHTVIWLPDGRSAETHRRAEAAGLVPEHTAIDFASRAEVILSICPPHGALGVSSDFRGFSGLYIDANAIAPRSVRRITKVHPRLVDAAIIGPPPTQSGTTRLFLSGPEAVSASALFENTTLQTEIVSAEVGAASATKMAYAAWSKGSQALLLATRELARAEGVEEALVAEWARSQPGLEERCARAAGAAERKGWRWEGEMQEIAASFAADGLPDGFHRAAAEIFARLATG